MKLILFVIFATLSFGASAHDSCSEILAPSEVDVESSYNDIVLPFYKTIHTDRFNKWYLEQLAGQAAQHVQVAAKLRELTSHPELYDDKRRVDFLRALADGATDLSSFIHIRARLEVLEWLKIYATGGPGPHYMGPGSSYNLRFQAQNLFPEVAEQMKQAKGFEGFGIVDAFEETLRKSEIQTRPLAQLRYNNRNVGLMKAIDPSVHFDNLVGVAVRLILPDQRVLDFTIRLRLKFNPEAEQTLYGLNEAEVREISHHEYEPTEGDAFLTGPSIIHPLKTLNVPNGDLDFDQILVEKVKSSEDKLGESIDAIMVTAANMIVEGLNDPNGSKAPNSISIRLFRKGTQLGVGSLILPLVEQRTGLKVYRREIPMGFGKLWQKRIIEVRHNLWSNTLAVDVEGSWFGMTLGHKTTQFK
jgi:hypothetical protein